MPMRGRSGPWHLGIMNGDTTFLARADYIGATADELSRKTTADKVAGEMSQMALFQRRGHITSPDDRLVLDEWSDDGDLVPHRSDVTSVEVSCTELDGRFLGGLLNAGKPLVLGTAQAGAVYLLIDRRELMETTDDRAWAERIDAWRSGEEI